MIIEIPEWAEIGKFIECRLYGGTLWTWIF